MRGASGWFKAWRLWGIGAFSASAMFWLLLFFFYTEGRGNVWDNGCEVVRGRLRELPCPRE